MKPAENYWEYEFLANQPLSDEEMASQVQTKATPQEIGWQKKFQFKRAMRHARAGHATIEELTYLARRNHYYPTTPKHLIIRPAKPA